MASFFCGEAASSLLSPWGKALSVGIVFPHMHVFALTMREKQHSRFVSLPHWGRGTASAVDRVLSYIVDLRRISPLIFHPARTLSGSLRSPPSPRGEGFVSGIALLSYRCLPHWGMGTASAVDRVLPHIVDLRRSFPLFFIPLSPSNLRPFGAPPSIGRRECPREPLPMEGAAERSEAGLAFFFAAKPPPLCLPH